jgi:carbon storage regulator
LSFAREYPRTRHGGQTMLILTRKEGEKIIIADNIEITIQAIKGGQVKIGIEAPDDVLIVRQELLGTDET